MPFTGIADSDQLKILTDVLDDHCSARGILEESDRYMAAVRVMALFCNGAQSSEQLKAGLAATTTRK